MHDQASRNYSDPKYLMLFALIDIKLTCVLIPFSFPYFSFGIGVLNQWLLICKIYYLLCFRDS